MRIDDNIITADDGMVLTNGEVYSEKVYLGINDRPENWREIPISEVPEGGEPEGEPGEATLDDYAEALELLGVTV